MTNISAIESDSAVEMKSIQGFFLFFFKSIKYRHFMHYLAVHAQ